MVATATKPKSAKKPKAEKKAPKKKPGKNEPLRDYEREHYNEITEGEKHVRELELDMEAKKEVFHASKKNFVAADRDLRMKIRKGPSPQRPLPFGDAAISNGSGHASKEVPGVGKDVWRSVTLAEIGITGKPLESLAEAGITTVGHFEDHRAKSHNGDWFSSIAGIGRAGADKLENAVLDWLSKNRKVEPAAEKSTKVKLLRDIQNEPELREGGECQIVGEPDKGCVWVKGKSGDVLLPADAFVFLK